MSIFRSTFQYIVNRESYAAYQNYRQQETEAKLQTLYPLLKGGLWLVWSLWFIMLAFTDHLFAQPWRFILTTYFTPIVAFQLLSSVVGLRHWFVDRQGAKFKYFKVKGLIFGVFAVPLVYFLIENTNHPYIRPIHKDEIVAAQVGDSLFVSNELLKSSSALTIYYLRRPINADDINQMKISKAKKSQMIFKLDTAATPVEDTFDLINTNLFFEKGSAFIGTLKKIDSSEIGAYERLDDFDLMYIPINLELKRFNLSNQPMLKSEGYVNAGEYFVRRKDIELKDHLRK